MPGLNQATKSPLPGGAAVVGTVCCAGLVGLAVYRTAWVAAVLCAAVAWVAATAPRGGRRAAVVSMGRGIAREQRALPLGLRWRLPSPPSILASAAAATAAAMAFLIKRPRILDRPGSTEEEFHGDFESGSSSSCSSTSILDLPDLALDSILSRLPADSLLRVGSVSRDLRRRCRSDHLWEALVAEKWGKIAGPAVYRRLCRDLSVAESRGKERMRMVQEIAAKNACELLPVPGWKKLLWSCSCSSPSILVSWLWNRLVPSSRRKALRPSDSLMAWYWALETGTLWFRGQVFNRESGHVGFLMSCYDAELSYVRSTNSFRARYPSHGPRALVVEENISWERVRAPPVETQANELHTSDCLSELHPGDHVEVQWRRTKEFPYGWWYGIVGHSESCANIRNNNTQQQHCSCRSDNTVWLVFNQYTSGSRWKRTPINQRDHREEGNDTDGFYGGIRKLRSHDEIARWKKLWPVDILE